MYLEHYKLKSKPFQITADPRFLWLGDKHKEALATLKYGIVDNRGFLLLTGEVGTGKTVLINRLVTLLNIDTVVATLTDPDLESMDFYNLLADGLNMERTFDSKGAFLIHLRDFLHQSYSNQQQVLLIIDESQRLNHRLMEDIRVLSNIEMHDRKLINIFFVGQQEFNSILMTPQNRALAQRITVRYHIEPLDEKETREYIEHRLKVAGTTRQIFDRLAIKEIHRFSGGIPRLINIISDHALLTGYAKGAKQINAPFVKECAEDLRIPVKKTMPDHHQEGDSIGILNTVPISEDQKQPPALQATGDQKDRRSNQSNQTLIKEIQDNQTQKSAGWKFAYAVMILVLIGIVAFAITHFTTPDKPRWDTDDLTPQKYRDTLNKETELLSNQMNRTKAEGIDEKTDRKTPDEKKTSDDDAQKQPQEASLSIEDEKQSGSDSDQVSAVLKPVEVDEVIETVSVDKVIGEIEPLPLLQKDLIINFNINSNEIDADSFAMLDRVAHFLVRRPEKTALVKGYTDSTGSEGYNESVSLFRANNVKSYLIGKGVPSENIKIFAMGASNPIASNESFEGRRKNRRVEIELSQE